MYIVVPVPLVSITQHLSPLHYVLQRTIILPCPGQKSGVGGIQDPFSKMGSMSLGGVTSSISTGVSSQSHGWQLTSVLVSCGPRLTCLTFSLHSQCPTALWALIMTV